MRFDFLPAPDEREFLRAEIAWTKRFLTSRRVLLLVGSLYLAAQLMGWFARTAIQATGRIGPLHPIHPILSNLYSLAWLGFLFAVFRARVLLRFRGGSARDIALPPVPLRAIFPALLVAPTAILLVRALPDVVGELARAILQAAGWIAELDRPARFAEQGFDHILTFLLVGPVTGLVIGFGCLCFAAGACANGGGSGEAIVRWLAASVAWMLAMFAWRRIWPRLGPRVFNPDWPPPEFDADTFRPSELLLRVLDTQTFESLVWLVIAAVVAVVALRRLQSDRFRRRLAEHAART